VITRVTDIRAAWDRFWYAPVDPVRLDAFRQAFTYTLVFYTLAWAQHGAEWLTDAGYHPSPAADAYRSPHVPLLTSSTLLPFFAVYLGAMVAVIFGWARRLATCVVLAGVVYVSLADPVSAFTLNRLYVFGFLILALAPGPSGHGPEARIPAWPIRVMQVSLLVHYVASGLCKAVRGDWLAADDVLWVQVQGVYCTDAAAWLLRVLPTGAWTILQHLALGFELLAPLLLIPRRLRPFGFILGIGLHLVVAVTMYQLIYFSLQMICFYLLFVDDARLRRALARLS
jgi:hypothetical protein